jgi:hypothetical protein
MIGSDISSTSIGILAKILKVEDIERSITDLDSSTSKIFDET